jgi:hypothetical protein
MGRFPLVGAHITADCSQCHKSESLVRFDVPGINCIDCHRQNYMATTNPNHVLSGISQDCIACHPVNSFQWTGAGFNNHNIFPLLLGHSTAKCSDCHIGGNYTTVPTACYSCHRQNFLAANSPNHVTGGFSTSCETCHTLTPGWTPATFNHGSFPLTLGHATPTCNDCHKGNYTTTSTDCYACHQTDYTNATNPSHKTLNFATLCTQCHTTNPGWAPATYTAHDTQFFPIYSGTHKGRWSNCSECHTITTNYALFNCIVCHQNAHSGQNYTNAQCYSCHPNGSAGG